MTVKTIHKRSKAKFKMPAIRRRAKKMMRKRYKKTISLGKVDKVWKDWVELMIVQPLLKGGKVSIDKRFSLEVVGERITKNTRAFNLMKSGIMVTSNGMVKKSGRLNDIRKGLKYSIVMEDGYFKDGKLMYKATPEIKKRVSEALKNTNTYYRIKQ